MYSIFFLFWTQLSYVLVSCCNSNLAWDSLRALFFRFCTLASTKNNVEDTRIATTPTAANTNDQPKKLLSCPSIQPFVFAHVTNTITAIPPHRPPANNNQDIIWINWTNLKRKDKRLYLMHKLGLIWIHISIRMIQRYSHNKRIVSYVSLQI